MKSHRYDEPVHDKWVRRIGRDFDVTGPSGEHHLDQTVLDVTWPTGCYIGVGADQRVLYVGMVDRTVRDGFSARIRDHHIDVLLWHRVWLLPMRPMLPRRVVAMWEAMLIEALNPPLNHVRPKVRIGRQDAL